MSDAIACPPTASRRCSWPLLGLAGLILAAGAVWLLAPALPQRLSSSPSVPPPLGDPPMAIGSVGGDLAERQPRPERPADAPVALRAASGREPAAPVQAPVVEPPPIDAAAAGLLAEAEQHYAAMEWDRAASLAGRIRGPTALAQRAADLARGAVALKRLFAELDDRDELCRNWDTHPSLLAVDGSPTRLLPLVALDEPLVAVLDDPLGWTERLRSAGRAGCFLVKSGGSFTRAEIVPEAGRLVRVDQQALAVQLGQQLDRAITRIDGDTELRADPNAWYEAGKFAYRNRLDVRVTPLLDRAFHLDPELAATVREGNAEALCGAMVGHLKQGNRQQAAGFMAMIERRYADTRQAQLARLYYQGRTAELLAAAPPPEPVAAPAPAAQPVAPAPAAAPDLALARQLSAQGAKPCYQAMGLPATDERNRLYHQALTLLRQAKAAYAVWCQAHPEDATAAAEAFEASRLEAVARKYATL